MTKQKSPFYTRRRALCAALAIGCLVLCARHLFVYGQDKSDFPDGFDAIQAAPKSHRVVFENAFVRVLEVNVLSGTTVPMHHHRWPSPFSDGTQAASRPTSTTVARMGAFGMFRARTRQLIPALEVWSE